MALQSVAEQIANLPPAQRDEALGLLSDAEAQALLYDWRGFLARPDQVAPEGDWDIWLCLAGRGWGKTRTGAEWVREQVKNGARRIALVAETQKDLEEVLINGDSGILAVCPPDERPQVKYKPVRLTFPNGAIALGYNATEPNQLRGPQFDAALCDELAKWRYARDTWDMLQFGLRLGDHPRVCVTTTPRAIELVKAIVAGQEGKVHITRGSTMDNRANLARRFIERIEARYAGTRLGRQEINAEILSDLPGAIWTQATIDTYRVGEPVGLGRTVVAVDPAVTNTDESDEHGIVVAGLGADQQGFLLEDSSQQGSPLDWAKTAVALYHKYSADGIVVEVNQGGDMVAHTIRGVAPNANIIEVRASKGKHVRAEPIAALYEQGRIRHVGQFAELENQMTQFTNEGYQGEGSPDRVDALVWAFSELFPDMVDVVPDASKLAFGPSRGGSFLAS